MGSPSVGKVERGVDQPAVALGLATDGLSLCPHPGGAELGILLRGVGIGAEELRADAVAHSEAQLHVGVEVEHLGVVLHAEQGIGWGYLRGVGVLAPGSGGISVVAHRGVHGGGSVEEILRVKELVVLLRRTEHAQVDGQEVVKRLLHQVHLGDEVPVGVVLHHRPVVQVADGCAVVGGFVAAAEGQVMVLHEARSGDGLREVGVVAAVNPAFIPLLGQGDVFAGIEHLDVLIDGLQAHVDIIGYLEGFAVAFHRGHLDDTRGTS